jgi:uncharacterized membrane protein YedE/YeeE
MPYKRGGGIGLLVALVIGLAIGWALYKGRVCFANMFLQTVYLKDRRGMAGIFLILLMTSAAVFFIQLVHQLMGLPLPQGVWHVGIPTLFGAFLFGVGMTLAGSCTASALVRVGEGTKTYLLVVLGIMAGFFLADIHYFAWWRNAYIITDKTIWRVMPWGLAAFFQLMIIFICYMFLKGVRKNEEI